MKSRIVLGFVIVALLVPFSGCPPTPQVSLGVWLFSIDIAAAAVELGADGMAQPLHSLPPEASVSFSGTLSWTQNGSTFTFTQTAFNASVVYTGTVDSSTTIIDGTWIQTGGGGESGTWTGMKL